MILFCNLGRSRIINCPIGPFSKWKPTAEYFRFLLIFITKTNIEPCLTTFNRLGPGLGIYQTCNKCAVSPVCSSFVNVILCRSEHLTVWLLAFLTGKWFQSCILYFLHSRNSSILTLIASLIKHFCCYIHNLYFCHSNARYYQEIEAWGNEFICNQLFKYYLYIFTPNSPSPAFSTKLRMVPITHLIYWIFWETWISHWLLANKYLLSEQTNSITLAESAGFQVVLVVRTRLPKQEMREMVWSLGQEGLLRRRWQPARYSCLENAGRRSRRPDHELHRAEHGWVHSMWRCSTAVCSSVAVVWGASPCQIHVASGAPPVYPLCFVSQVWRKSPRYSCFGMCVSAHRAEWSDSGEDILQSPYWCSVTLPQGASTHSAMVGRGREE